MFDFNKLRNIGAGTDNSYLKLKLGDGSYAGKKELGETIRSTYSLLKQDVDGYWNAEGTSPNVTNAVINSMNSPMVINNRNFYAHSCVGDLNGYNEIGNPRNGGWTFHMIG